MVFDRQLTEQEKHDWIYSPKGIQSAADSDGDGVSDAQEIMAGTSALSADATPDLPVVSSDVERFIANGNAEVMVFKYDANNDNGQGQTEYTIDFPENVIADVLIVGGGGSGGGKDYGSGGGGGGGGVVHVKTMTIPAGTYNNAVQVGRGGHGTKGRSDTGEDEQGKHSLAFGIVGYGGGAGSDFVNTNGRDFDVANEGGSGGGGGPFSERDGFVGGKASGDIYSVSQLVAGIEYNELMAYAGNGGTNMRTGGAGTAGGGGGAGEDGLPGYANEPGYTSSITNGRGGDGIQIDILGTPTWWGAGGGGATGTDSPAGSSTAAGNGGKGGGGGGGNQSSGPKGVGGSDGYNGATGGNGSGNNGGHGADHTGSGGGGGTWADGVSGNGGSGVVIIRYQIDSDGDGIGNADEIAAGTSPNDATSVPMPDMSDAVDAVIGADSGLITLSQTWPCGWMPAILTHEIT